MCSRVACTVDLNVRVASVVCGLVGAGFPAHSPARSSVSLDRRDAGAPAGILLIGDKTY
jgi:hypothetical protein